MSTPASLVSNTCFSRTKRSTQKLSGDSGAKTSRQARVSLHQTSKKSGGASGHGGGAGNGIVPHPPSSRHPVPHIRGIGHGFGTLNTSRVELDTSRLGPAEIRTLKEGAGAPVAEVPSALPSLNTGADRGLLPAVGGHPFSARAMPVSGMYIGGTQVPAPLTSRGVFG